MTRSSLRFSRIGAINPVFVLFATAAFLLCSASAAMAHGYQGKGKGKHGHWGPGPKPAVVVVQATGSLHLTNPTEWAFQVRLNGASAGLVPAGGTLTVPNARLGQNTVEARVVGAPDAPPQRMVTHVAPGQAVQLGLIAPVASVRVHNKQATTATLFVNGVQRGVLPPGGHMRVEGLLAGPQRLELTGPYGLIAGRTMRLSAGERGNWSPSPAVGSVSVRNHAQAAVQVRLEGSDAVWVAPGASAEFLGVPVGTRLVRVTNKHGESVTSQLNVAPRQTASWSFVPPAPGQLYSSPKHHGPKHHGPKHHAPKHKGPKHSGPKHIAHAN